MNYIKLFEEFTSATGGNAGAITGGEVYNMPVSGGSTMTPNSISMNTGSINMNNTQNLDAETYDVLEEEPNEEAKVKQKKKKSKIQSELEDSEEDKIEKEEQPIMNWDTYLKKNINKIKECKIFESEEILTGWRAQNAEELHMTTGSSATEGEGYYMFYDKEEADDWFNTKYIFEIKYKTPKKTMHVDFLGSHNSFLMWDMGDELFEPIKDNDNEWIKMHKLAIQKYGENLTECIKELTKLLKESGYDAVSIDDTPYWIVILDPSLIISTKRYDNPDYNPNI